MVERTAVEQSEAVATGRLAIAIDRGAEVPIGVQIAWAIRAKIGDGTFAPGQRLPGLRDLAEAIGVNVNTVRAVYQRLEYEGLIESQQGSGTFVAPTTTRSPAVGQIAAGAAREARENGVDPRDVAAALYVSPDASIWHGNAGTEPRRLLRTQIAALERALGELEADHPGIAHAPLQSHRIPDPRLLSGEELARVRTALVHRLVSVQAAVDGVGQELSLPSPQRVPKPQRAAAKKRARRPKITVSPAPSART